MIRVVQGARWSAALVALGLFMSPVAVSAAANENTKAEAEADREVAQVKIEIKLESGRVVKPDDLFTVDYGVENALEIQADGSSHQLKLKVDRKGNKGKFVALTVGYDRDGEAVVAPYTFDAKVKKREVLRIEGGMALAFTITPKKLAGKAPEGEDDDPSDEPQDKKKPRDKIETDCPADDPLCGV